MNPQLKKFKILTTWIEEGKVENLLEGTLYLKDAFRFIDLLLDLDKNSFKYKLLEGFKGQTHFKEKENKFKDIIIEISENEIRNVIEFFNNSTKYNEILKVTEIDINILKIQLRD